jgi:anti-sigma-K factor RskA
MTDRDDDSDDILAADYALGALGADERRLVELRIGRDPQFRALVAAWQHDLTPLAETVADVVPPPAVWARIDAAIAPAQVTQAKPSLWNSLALWRGLAGGGIATAAVALALLVARPAPEPILATTLASPDGAALMTAAFDPGRRAVILTPAGGRGDAEHSPELWVIEGNGPPRSLGVIDMTGPQSRVIPADRLVGLKAGAVLAISIEPRGGSPTGLPTGPVVATGKLAAV